MGGGAAGMMAAITAARLGCPVTILERNPKLGRKLYITGKGRCNVTNHCSPEEVLAATPRNGKFLYSAVNRTTPADVEAFFEALGVPLKVERGNRVFPKSDRAADILPIIDYCEGNLIRFYSVPNMRNYLKRNMVMETFDDVVVLAIRREPLSSPGKRFVKRLFDIVVSGLFLCTIYPFIYIAVGIAIKFSSPGPIYFKQKRNGLDGKVFECIKFRSMKVNAQSDTLQATKDDPRKTKVGNFLRKTNLDELPQFINVFKGDMSIVGPRPHMLKHNEEYSHLIDRYMVRHFVKPGITGWAQVNGFRGETKKLSEMAGRVQADIWYLEHWSFWLDVRIIFKTVSNMIHGEEKAY